MEALSREWLLSIFAEDAIDEILINGCHSLQRLGHDRAWADSPFSSDELMRSALQKLAYSQGQRLDPLRPAAGGLLSVDLALPAASLHLRWHALLPPIARDGPLLSLRRHRFESLRVEDFLDPYDLQALRSALSGGEPLFIIGPTGAGKTSLLISLLSAWAFEERVAILEQVPEVPRLSPHWIRLCAQTPDISGQGSFGLSAVFDELLRLRPDRLVIGELRNDEASSFRRSLLAGHGAAWCTLHCAHPGLLARRLADLSGDAGSFWEELLAEKRAVVCVMQRKRPRLSEAWQFRNHAWELIFSPREK